MNYFEGPLKSMWYSLLEDHTPTALSVWHDWLLEKSPGYASLAQTLLWCRDNQKWPVLQTHNSYWVWVKEIYPGRNFLVCAPTGDSFGLSQEIYSCLKGGFQTSLKSHRVKTFLHPPDWLPARGYNKLNQAFHHLSGAIAGAKKRLEKKQSTLQ